MTKCDKCNQYYFTKTHHCEEFEFSDEDGDIHTVSAIDLRQALDLLAEKFNEENELIDNFVTVSHNGKKWNLSAELDIKYSARLVI